MFFGDETDAIATKYFSLLYTFSFYFFGLA